MGETQAIIGPVLILDDIRDGRMHLAALFISPRGLPVPAITSGGAQFAPQAIAAFGDADVWRVRFDVPADADSRYHWNGTDYALASDLTGDLRLGYLSCNGEEHGDLDRDPRERNRMLRRLGEQHADTPYSLLLHGGDQIYADEATDAHPLTRDWPDVADGPPDPVALEELRSALRQAFFDRYATLYAHADFAWLAARVPSLMQWDDHDICDGWGSLPEAATGSAVGQTLFSVAREAALIFQHGTVDGDLPARFADPSGAHLGWQVAAPGFRIVAPDLRSERGLTRVMAEGGWDFITRALSAAPRGHTFLMSSVPLLGPRLSVIEGIMHLIPGLQKYEDDLRDQWQSRAHRAAWVRMLRLVADHPGPITALSGEIHLAARAEMPVRGGRVLHQLVASGVTHRPPPRAWARALGALAAFGEDPIPDAPIKIRALPGARTRYRAERNTLALHRAGQDWSALWDLEDSGPTPPLLLEAGAQMGADRL